MRMLKFPLTTNLNLSHFHAKELILSVPVITLLTFLILIFLSFEIQSCWQFLSELIFNTSRIKLTDSLIFFPGDVFHYQTVITLISDYNIIITLTKIVTVIGKRRNTEELSQTIQGGTNESRV